MKHYLKTFLSLAILGLVASTSSFSATFSEEQLSNSFSLGEVDKKPDPISQPQPAITDELRNQKGKVYVAFIVNEKGKVEQLRCIKSDSPKLRTAVLDAVEKWKFKPAEKGDNKVAVRVVLPIRVDFS